MNGLQDAAAAGASSGHCDEGQVPGDERG